jgi:hypothetical protein
MDTAALKLGQQDLELAITNQGIPTYEGEMERLLAVDNCQQPADEVVAFVIGELAEVDTRS